MILLTILFFGLLMGSALIGENEYSAYDEFCNLECWSRRKPCCKTS